jgi:hypothetical protein
MAQPTNLYDRYAINPSVREDLLDKIWNTDPDEVPVMTAIGRSAAMQTYHEWQRDFLATPNKDNAAIDGNDFSAQALIPTNRIGNYCQIFVKQPAVSRRANIVRKAGMGNAMSYQKAKLTKELKRDIEAMLLSSNVAVAGNSTTASKSAGFGAMIFTNVSQGVGGSTPAHNSGAATVAPTAGTARTFVEQFIKDACALAYSNSGEVPEMVVMSPNHKQIFSTFSGIALNRYQIPANQQAHIIGGADIYMSNFGQLDIVPHYVLVGSPTVYMLNPDYASVAFLDGFRYEEMGKTGDSDKVLITADLTLRLDSEKANAKITDLTP